MAKRISRIGSKQLENQLEKFYKKGNSIQTSADEFHVPFSAVRHFLGTKNLIRPRSSNNASVNSELGCEHLILLNIHACDQNHDTILFHLGACCLVKSQHLV